MNQRTLNSFGVKGEGPTLRKVTVFVDNRESRSRIGEYLRELDVNVVERQLSVADYVASDRVGIERKNVNELAGSIYTNRLFDECSRLKDAYEIPILVLEGYMPVIFKMRKINETSIWGALTSIAVELKIAMVPTPDTRHTARFIERVAYSEQVKVKRPIVIRPKEKVLTLTQQQQYLVCGLPNVGIALAENLLSEAQTPLNVFKQIADAEVAVSKSGKTRRLSGSIAEVKGIGPTIVERAKKVLVSPYLRDPQQNEKEIDKALINEGNSTDIR